MLVAYVINYNLLYIQITLYLLGGYVGAEYSLYCIRSIVVSSITARPTVIE